MGWKMSKEKDTSVNAEQHDNIEDLAGFKDNPNCELYEDDGWDEDDWEDDYDGHPSEYDNSIHNPRHWDYEQDEW